MTEHHPARPDWLMECIFSIFTKLWLFTAPHHQPSCCYPLDLTNRKCGTLQKTEGLTVSHHSQCIYIYTIESIILPSERIGCYISWWMSMDGICNRETVSTYIQPDTRVFINELPFNVHLNVPKKKHLIAPLQVHTLYCCDRGSCNFYKRSRYTHACTHRFEAHHINSPTRGMSLSFSVASCNLHLTQFRWGCAFSFVMWLDRYHVQSVQ